MPKNYDRKRNTSQSMASPSADDAACGVATSGRKARWGILVVACLAQLMVVLDGTIVNIALPSAQADLGFDDHGRQWVVTAYALAFGSLLLVGGRLGDLFGRRPAFLLGLVGFAIASAVGNSRLLTRSNKAKPACASIVFSALLTAGCDSASSSAAATVVRWRMTARRISS